jgi:hypothetical protein
MSEETAAVDESDASTKAGSDAMGDDTSKDTSGGTAYASEVDPERRFFRTKSENFEGFTSEARAQRTTRPVFVESDHGRLERGRRLFVIRAQILESADGDVRNKVARDLIYTQLVARLRMMHHFVMYCQDNRT